MGVQIHHRNGPSPEIKSGLEQKWIMEVQRQCDLLSSCFGRLFYIGLYSQHPVVYVTDDTQTTTHATLRRQADTAHGTRLAVIVFCSVAVHALVTDSVSEEDNEFGRVPLSGRLFPFYPSNRLISNRDFFARCDPRSPRFEFTSRSRSRVGVSEDGNAVGLSLTVDRGQLF